MGSPSLSARDLVAAHRHGVRVTPTAATPVRPGPVADRTGSSATGHEMPGVYGFAPRRSSRRVLSMVLLVGLAASAYLVRAAVTAEDSAAIGMAAIVCTGTAMVWALRRGASLTTLTVRNGQLEVVKQGRRFVFDLASRYTPVEVVGEPGRRGWQVRFLRRGMPAFVVDATVVDPHDFMRVLRFFRSGVVS